MNGSTLIHSVQPHDFNNLPHLENANAFYGQDLQQEESQVPLADIFISSMNFLNSIQVRDVTQVENHPKELKEAANESLSEQITITKAHSPLIAPHTLPTANSITPFQINNQNELDKTDQKTYDKKANAFTDFFQSLWHYIFPTAENGDLNLNSDSPSKESPTADYLEKREKQRQETNQIIKDMQKLMHHMKDLHDNELSEQNFESFILQMFLSQILLKNEQSDTNKHWMQKTYAEWKDDSDKRFQQWKENLKNAKEISEMDFADKILSGIGLLAAVTQIATPMGAVCAILGLGLLADNIADDFVKKKIIEALPIEKKEEKDKWLGYFQLGLGVLGIGLNMGIAGMQALSGFVHLTEGSSTALKGYLTHEQNNNKATLLELDDTVDRSNDRLQRAMDSIKLDVEAIFRYYKNLSQSLNHQNQAKKAMVK